LEYKRQEVEGFQCPFVPNSWSFVQISIALAVYSPMTNANNSVPTAALPV
jgi:hypothetical protein